MIPLRPPAIQTIDPARSVHRRSEAATHSGDWSRPIRPVRNGGCRQPPSGPA